MNADAALADDWLVRFRSPFAGREFPRPLAVAVETRANAAYCLRGRLRRDRNHGLFQYTLSGEGVFENAAGRWPVPAEHGFLCETRWPDIAYYYPRRARRPWRFLFFCFDGAAALLLVRALCRPAPPIWHLPQSAPAIRRLLDMARIALAEKAKQAVDPVCEDGRRYFPAYRVFEMTVADGMALTMQLLAALQSARDQAAADAPASILVRRAVAALEHSQSAHWNVKQWADMLNVSREHLTRVFRAHLGQTPHAYLLRHRLAAAGDMVRRGECSVKEIADRLGFSSAAHFARVFQRVYGMPPKKFQLGGSVLMV